MIFFIKFCSDQVFFDGKFTGLLLIFLSDEFHWLNYFQRIVVLILCTFQKFSFTFLYGKWPKELIDIDIQVAFKFNFVRFLIDLTTVKCASLKSICKFFILNFFSVSLWRTFKGMKWTVSRFSNYNNCRIERENV